MSWDIAQLESLLTNNEDYVVTQERDCLLIANSDGLDAWLAVSGEQIVVESVLFGADEVADKAALNHAILSSHMIFPLSTVGISTIDGKEYYVAFGALSSQSKGESIEIEVDTLFDNVAHFIEAYSDYLK